MANLPHGRRKIRPGTVAGHPAVFGDGEVSGSGVSESVCEAPIFIEWSKIVVLT